MRFLSWKLVVLLCLLCPRPMAQAPTNFTLRQMTAASGYIFAGTVTDVRRMPVSHPNEVETISITIRVDEAVRGVRNGQTLAIREWAGLWNAGERYRPGERVVLMLYPPSVLGLTSPVGGAMGRFAVDSEGNVVTSLQPLANDPVAGPWLRGRKRVSGHDFTRLLRRVGKE